MCVSDSDIAYGLLLCGPLHPLSLQVLQTAKADERVRGLLAILGDRGNFGGMAQLQELRNALLDFRVRLRLRLRLSLKLGLS